MSISFGPDPVAAEVSVHLRSLEEGQKLPERQRVDYKEEAGRRDPRGAVLPGEEESEKAAQQLAREAACMANTPGGGALIVGVNDKGAGPLLIGTALDEEWLRFRIYQITNRMLTVDVRAVTVSDVRLLVITCPRAIEPIRFDGKIRWRIGSSCQEVDAASWHSLQRRAMRFDWSAQASNLRVADVRPAAAEAARVFLQAARDDSAQELAGAPLPQLLARLNAVDGDGYLTNAAALIFVGRDEPILDYIRREAPGEDSQDRVRDGGRSLLEQLQATFAVARAHNPVTHVQAGLSIGQQRLLPERALREAIVNGLAHREWGLPDPTLVEHEGPALRVTSPGGFYGGVTAENIITHPSISRNTALAELLAALKVAEREGIGFDRMVGDLLRMGLRSPSIREISGPYVVCTLSGVNPDIAWTDWIRSFDSSDVIHNLRLLMATRFLTDQFWLDELSLAPYLQCPPDEARDTIAQLAATSRGGSPIIEPIPGTPPGSLTAFTLTPAARTQLEAAYQQRGQQPPTPRRALVARIYAEHRGRISTTELASIVGASPSNVGSQLKELEAEGMLAPSSPSRAGRGFHYRWDGEAPQT